MRRITISVDEPLAQEFDDLIANHGYENRSEAFRDLLRSRIEGERKTLMTAKFCVAVVSFIYDYRERVLASRLATLQHDHHDLTISTLHVHLDHATCMETVVLRGKFKEVSAFADRLSAENGVRHGNIHIVPVAMSGDHRHGHGHGHKHSHLAPIT
jgi:CopG family nickel-responsive transcriptional regulator